MTHLASLPQETLHSIFQWLRPCDLLALPLVCRTLRAAVYKNRWLWRHVYLRALDKPEDVNLDWESELRDVVRLEAICRRKTAAEKEHELGFVSQTLHRLLKRASSLGHLTENSDTHAASRNVDFLAELFKEPSTREAFLQRSFLFERIRNEHHGTMLLPESVKLEYQQSAKMHCLYGRPIVNMGRLRSTKTYPYAVSKVYDLRQYTDLTKWGPFMNDLTDRVDWEKVEAILIVLGHNLNRRHFTHLFGDIWDSPFSGSWPKSYLPSPAADLSPLEASDPYGVTGTWYRIICFLDYNDFLQFNFPRSVDLPPNAPRPPLCADEETRLIIMRVHVTAIHNPGPDDGQELPVVHFRGVSRALDRSLDDNADSVLRGTVRLTREGEVRWTTVSVYHGEERWRSEGVQVGGLRSARGVVGNWFDKDYDVQGPVGPTAFWEAGEFSATCNTMHDILSNDTFPTQAVLVDVDDSDPEAEMDYEDEEDEDEMDEYLDDEPVSNELPGLLLDAQLEVADIMRQTGQG